MEQLLKAFKSHDNATQFFRIRTICVPTMMELKSTQDVKSPLEMLGRLPYQTRDHGVSAKKLSYRPFFLLMLRLLRLLCTPIKIDGSI